MGYLVVKVTGKQCTQFLIEVSSSRARGRWGVVGGEGWKRERKATPQLYPLTLQKF